MRGACALVRWPHLVYGAEVAGSLLPDVHFDGVFLAGTGGAAAVGDEFFELHLEGFDDGLLGGGEVGGLANVGF